MKHNSDCCTGAQRERKQICWASVPKNGLMWLNRILAPVIEVLGNEIDVLFKWLNKLMEIKSEFNT